MARKVAGYVFGYATLADAGDELVLSTGGAAERVYGHLHGFRRRWNTGTDNRAPLNDHKHYVHGHSGERPDLCVVTLNVEPGDGRVNGIALPVEEHALPYFDRRELHYTRIEVSAAFSERLGLPVWTYVANRLALDDFAAAHARGRAFVRRGYIERVEAVFRAMGEEAWAAYRASTDPPESPLLDLLQVTADGSSPSGAPPRGQARSY